MVLIDDNDTDLFFHQIALKRAGFEGEVLSFERPAEAVEFLSNDPMAVATCVLVDINMPGMDGFEVAQRLCEHFGAEAPFILMMLTSSNWTDDRRRAAAIPLVQGYLIKPLTADMIAPVIQGRNLTSSPA